MLLIFFFSMMAFVMMESTFALYLNATFGYTVFQVGLFFTLAGVVIAVVQGGLVGRLTKKFGEWPLAIAGPLLVTTAMYLLATLTVYALVVVVVVAVIINATGRSLQTPTLSALISHTGDPRQQGTIFGLFHMLGSLARVVGPIMATLAYTHHHSAPYLMAGGITLAIAVWTAWLKTFVAAQKDQRAVPAAA